MLVRVMLTVLAFFGCMALNGILILNGLPGGFLSAVLKMAIQFGIPYLVWELAKPQRYRR